MCARRSSASARSSGSWTRISTISRPIRASAIAGGIRISSPPEAVGRPAETKTRTITIGDLWGLRRSISGRLVLLVVIFLLVPVVLYQAFRRADEEKRVLLIQSVQNQGQIIAAMLRPALQAFDRTGAAELGEWLKGI